MMLKKTSSILTKINQEAGNIMENHKNTFLAVTVIAGIALTAFKVMHFLKCNNCKISVVCCKCDKAEDLCPDNVKSED